MSRYRLVRTRFSGGRWEGVLTGPEGQPQLAVTLHDRRLDAVAVAPQGPGRWAVTVDIPADWLQEGVQTFLIRETGEGETLDSFAIMAGAPLDGDVRAELDLLRAELDLLKRAFRRHVAAGEG